jgi:hypothetical protein
MNKLNVFESLNNAIVREQNMPEVLAEKKRYLVLNKFYMQKNKLDDAIHINFGIIFLDQTFYSMGKIRTKYKVEIDTTAIIDVEYGGKAELKLTYPDFLNVGREEVCEVGGIKKLDYRNDAIYALVDKYYLSDDVLYQNKYDFKVNGWEIPEDSFLILEDWNVQGKNNVLSVFTNSMTRLYIKFGEIFSLERR